MENLFYEAPNPFKRKAPLEKPCPIAIDVLTVTLPEPSKQSIEHEKPLVAPLKTPKGKTFNKDTALGLTTNYNQPVIHRRLQGGHVLIEESIEKQSLCLKTSETNVREQTTLTTKTRTAESAISFKEKVAICNKALASNVVVQHNHKHRKNGYSETRALAEYKRDLEQRFNVCSLCNNPIKIKYANPLILRFTIERDSEGREPAINHLIDYAIIETRKRKLWEAQFTRKAVNKITDFDETGKRTQGKNKIIPTLAPVKLPSSLFYADIRPYWQVIPSNDKWSYALNDGSGVLKYYRPNAKGRLSYHYMNELGEYIPLPYYVQPNTFRVLGKRCECWS